MHRRNVGIAHVRDQRNARRPEARIFGRARNLCAEFGGEFAVHGRAMHADLLEQPSAHHTHHTATAGLAGMVGAVPGTALEARGIAGIERYRRVVFELLERRADVIAQALEPAPGACLAILDHGHVHLRYLLCAAVAERACRSASPNAIAAAIATLSERKPGLIGITSRASAAATTSSGPRGFAPEQQDVIRS
jgi:hypothetical protein